jgi:predicted transcriptional regulator
MNERDILEDDFSFGQEDASKGMIRLPQAEMEIMLIIWEANGPVSSGYILDKFKSNREWALPTLMTVLTRLVNKGFISCSKVGRHNRYDIVVDGREYLKFYIANIMKSAYKNSFLELTKALYEGDAITRQDILDVADEYR